ncbi:MAG: acyl-CoA/acyl-ACP dehydrogenase [Alcanivoracaceae bacterium]|nr:acyl-CoA/acyl-ACP dehydrogenase [Alcanivoracaceae bacterium]
MRTAPLDHQDISLLLDEVASFSNSRIAQLTARSDHPIDADTLIMLSHEAAALGILPATDSNAGYALWEQTDDAGAMAFSVGALVQIACANAGVAMAWHRASLAQSMCRMIGLPLEQDSPIAMTAVASGHIGVARSALAHWLQDRTHDDDHLVLCDWLDRRLRHTLVTAAPMWEHLLWPMWHDDAIFWQRLRRDQVMLHPCRHQHGFDELHTWQVSAAPDIGERVRATPAQLSALITLDSLGLLAISTGIARHGKQMAEAYTGVRKQGGKTIIEHPAVQNLLGTIRQVHWEARTTLHALSRPLAALSVRDVMMARQQLLPRLCLAANHVMQVHGGIGYMQDCGPEKLLRDQNMLRLQSGGVRDIPLFLQAWAEA